MNQSLPHNHDRETSSNLPPKNKNSITISKPTQKSLVISIPTQDKGPILFTKTKPQQPTEKTISINQPSKVQQDIHQYDFTEEELEMQEIAKQNQQIVLSRQYPISNSHTIFEDEHLQISAKMSQLHPRHQNTPIIINKLSTIGSTIEIHNTTTFSICILNFADPFKPGGGYLNGRSPQEETLCRQTLLHPTLLQSEMYTFNQSNPANVYFYDTMIYSPNIRVIRDDTYSKLNENGFTVNVISAPAVDCRKIQSASLFLSSEEIMEKRIRRIVMLAADRGCGALVLGAFGCGVFRNEPGVVGRIFRKVLVDEGLKDHFAVVVFPIYKSDRNFCEFREAFGMSLEEEGG